jgi:hypothetical protein
MPAATAVLTTRSVSSKSSASSKALKRLALPPTALSRASEVDRAGAAAAAIRRAADHAGCPRPGDVLHPQRRRGTAEVAHLPSLRGRQPLPPHLFLTPQFMQRRHVAHRRREPAPQKALRVRVRRHVHRR